MRKTICLLFVFVAMLFSGCILNQEEKISGGMQLAVSDNYDYHENGMIPYKITNTTQKKMHFTAIPFLETKVGSDWKEIPLEGVAFCGVPDGVEQTYEGNVLLEWYGGELPKGEYKLSFRVVDGKDYHHLATISDEFAVN